MCSTSGLPIRGWQQSWGTLTHIQVVTRVALTFTCCGGLVHDLWVLATEPSEKARYTHYKLDSDTRLVCTQHSSYLSFSDGVMGSELVARDYRSIALDWCCNQKRGYFAAQLACWTKTARLQRCGLGVELRTLAPDTNRLRIRGA